MNRAPNPNPAETTLYSAFDSISSNCVRMVITEKDIDCSTHYVSVKNMPEEILELNPYQSLPTLYDRELVLFDLIVMLEYLDERFPFPPLMPVDPIERADKRQLLFRMYRSDDSWHTLAQTALKTRDKANSIKARDKLRSQIIQITPVFANQPYFKSDEFTMVDAFLASLFLRLGKMGIDLPRRAHPVIEYRDRLFSRESFEKSLTDLEKEYL